MSLISPKTWSNLEASNFAYKSSKSHRKMKSEMRGRRINLELRNEQSTTLLTGRCTKKHEWTYSFRKLFPWTAKVTYKSTQHVKRRYVQHVLPTKNYAHKTMIHERTCFPAETWILTWYYSRRRVSQAGVIRRGRWAHKCAVYSMYSRAFTKFS